MNDNQDNKYKKFRDYISEAYDIVPSSVKDIEKMNLSNGDEIINLYIDLKKILKNDDLVVIEKSKAKHPSGKVKILRMYKSYQGILTDIIQRHNHLFNSSFDFFGDGSSKYSKNANAQGRKLGNAGELATVLSLSIDIQTPQDTKQKVFIENPDLFNNWKDTFIYTKIAVNQIVKNIKDYIIIHDATDTGDFTKTIKKFTKKSGLSKDFWNPADIFLINKSMYKYVINKLNTIIENNDKDLVVYFNNEIYNLYTQGILYPISLKQILGSYHIDYLNEPNKKVLYYNIKIKKFNINMNIHDSTKELGVFEFINVDTNGNILMQIRTFPFGFSPTQVEITSDGTKSGGRIGKVSTSIVDYVLGQYGTKRLGTKDFGDKKHKFKNFSRNDFENVKLMIKYIKSNLKGKSKIQDIDIEYNDIINLSELEKTILMNKIQGLKFAYFFAKNENEISNIMNDFIYGAKKVGKLNGFYIKIY